MSENKFKMLFTPIKIGSVVLKNRIVCAPSSLNWINEDGSLSQEAIAYYEQAAMGGCAMVTYGEVIVHPTGQSHDRQLDVNDPRRMVSLGQFSRAMHRHGALASAELSHGGKYGGLASLAGELKEGKVAYGASAEITPEGEVFEMPHDMVVEVCESFGKGALNLMNAGFDMCMVHAGHGWFFSQFLSTKTNHRTDEFGGSFENRAKPLIMALDSIRSKCGRNFPIEVRISGDEFIDGGLTIEDAKKLVLMIQDKCDMINVSAGIHEGPELFIRTHPTHYAQKGPNVYLAAEIKKIAKIPISTVGALGEPSLMEEILETGKADVLEMRRPLMADPYMPRKLAEGREDEVVKCLRCNSCFGESLKTGNILCVVNPVIGQEYYNWMVSSKPIEKKKKVVVVGGGPGGLKAALTCAKRGHEVVLYEKSDKLGGALNYFKYVDFKYDMYYFGQVLERMLRRTDAVIHTGVEATREVIEAEKPDVLFVAVGADPIVIPMPGAEKVKLAIDIFGKTEDLGDEVIVMGGGLVGCETAAYLAREGKKVHIVEMRPDIAIDADIFCRAAVGVDLRKNGAMIHCGAAGQEVTDEGLIVKNQAGELELIKGDSVVSAVGFRSRTQTFLDLNGIAPVTYSIGDCRKVGKVTNAVSEGYYISLDI